MRASSASTSPPCSNCDGLRAADSSVSPSDQSLTTRCATRSAAFGSAAGSGVAQSVRREPQRPSELPSTSQPEWLAFWLEARSKNSGVQRVREAIAHVRRTFVFDVHVELTCVRQQEVHDGAVIGELSPRECQLKRSSLFSHAVRLSGITLAPPSLASTHVSIFWFCSQEVESQEFFAGTASYGSLQPASAQCSAQPYNVVFR